MNQFSFGVKYELKNCQSINLNGKKNKEQHAFYSSEASKTGESRAQTGCRGFVHIESDRQMTGEQRRHCALPLCEGTVAPNTL